MVAFNRRLMLASMASLIASPAFGMPTNIVTGPNFGKNGLPEVTLIMAGHDY